jgi:acyl-coenzyme A thioesterase PaaI-like protein
MTSRCSAPVHSVNEAIRARVLRAIAANRVPGLHFIGHFIGVEWQEISDGSARAALPDSSHCRNADGTINIVALGLIADIILAVPSRTGAAPGARLGTIHMQLQFTGAPAAGGLYAESRLLGRSEGAALAQSLSAGTIYANGKPVCYASGEFALLAPPPGVVLSPTPWERAEAPPPAAPVDTANLDAHERAILRVCDAALAKSSREAGFIEHLWGGAPRHTKQGATHRVPVGPHIGNRVGHVQGGILLGLAANTACAAAPAAMMLSNISAWYISPGRGTALAIRSRPVHAGRTIAVVRTEIKNASGERVLEAVSLHIARKHR